ncbi:hypothetical protein G6F23_013756 [Rhizopus arrhizus]|nr:hypothetical protein G6F23_013756 [Rhizopus arrhizus]
MQGGAGAGQCRAQRRVQPLFLQALHGDAQALGHALGGATGGRGQRDLGRRLAGLPGLCGQQQQQARDGGGLAGTGAACDQRQRMSQGHAGRARLVIFAAGRLREQMREQWCQRCHVRRRQRMPANALQAGDQLAFVLAVAAQVEQSVFQHQRRILGDGIGLLRRRHPG